MNDKKPVFRQPGTGWIIVRLANYNSCGFGHFTYYRLLKKDGTENVCMICFALGLEDPDRKPLEFVGDKRLVTEGVTKSPQTING